MSPTAIWYSRHRASMSYSSPRMCFTAPSPYDLYLSEAGVQKASPKARQAAVKIAFFICFTFRYCMLSVSSDSE